MSTFKNNPKTIELIGSSKTDHWGTPQDKFDEWDKEFDFTLDPCANPNRILKTPHDGMISLWLPEDDGLKKDWDNERVFCNPPYSKISVWVKKCFSQRNRAETIALLIFVRTDTRYFHDFINSYAELRFIKGRLKFVDIDNGVSNPAPFPSMLVIYRPDKTLSGQKNIIEYNGVDK